MSKIQKNQSGFGALEALLIVVIVGILGFTGWFVWHTKQTTDERLTANNSSVPSSTKQTSTTPTKITDPTANWQSFTSADGMFSIKYPKTWVQPGNQQYCDKTMLAVGLYLGPDEKSVLKCGSEEFGEISIDSNKELISGFDFSSGYTDVLKKSVTVDGVTGERISAVSSGQQQLLGSLPDGTVVAEYTFNTNGKFYVLHYIQKASFPDVLADFDLMSTRTLKFE